MATKLSELVKNKELSAEAAKRLHLTPTIDELYSLIRASFETGDSDMRQNVAGKIGISAENLRGYMDYIQPYVSKHILNPQKGARSAKTGWSMGAIVTAEQIKRMYDRNDLRENPEEAGRLHRRDYFSGMLNDSEWEAACLKEAERNKDFRDWIFDEDGINTSLDDGHVAKDIEEKQQQFKDKFYKSHPELK